MWLLLENISHSPLILTPKGEKVGDVCTTGYRQGVNHYLIRRWALLIFSLDYSSVNPHKGERHLCWDGSLLIDAIRLSGVNWLKKRGFEGLHWYFDGSRDTVRIFNEIKQREVEIFGSCLSPVCFWGNVKEGGRGRTGEHVSLSWERWAREGAAGQRGHDGRGVCSRQ